MFSTEQTQKKHTNYLMLISLPMRRVSPKSFAVESAFGEHLLRLRERIQSNFEKLIIVTPIMPQNTYDLCRQHLLEINEEQTGIYFEEINIYRFGLKGFLKACINPEYYHSILKVLRLIKHSDIVHSGPSISFFPTPFFIGLIYAIFKRNKTVFVHDIDLRSSARMLFKMKKISLKDYALLRFLFNVIVTLQINIGVKFCSLALLKSRRLVSDYAKGKGSVKIILDVAHSKENIIPGVNLAKKGSLLQNQNALLELIYFGRLVSYKGVDLSIKAVKLAKESGANIRFSIFGIGEEKENLLQLIDELSLKDIVMFRDPIRYGASLFQELYRYHILLATPLSNDTPRSAMDAMASGMAILAFDTSYYKEDIFNSGAVYVVPWPSIDEMAKSIVYFDKNRDKLQEIMRKAVTFAKKNTQEIWLDRRVRWTLALFEKRNGGFLKSNNPE